MIDPLECLSPAERKIMVEIFRSGDISKVVAHRLGIAKRTVEAHRERASKKLGLRNMFAVGALAVQLGYYKPQISNSFE